MRLGVYIKRQLYTHKDFGTATLAYPIELITKNPAFQRGSVEMSSSELECKNLPKKRLQA